MLSPDFEIEITPNRAALQKLLRARCAVPSYENLELWENAWDRFSIESFAQIPPIRGFPYHKADSPEKRKNYTLVYKREAVRRLLPKFREKREFLSGKARRNVTAIINLLESWKCELPAGIAISRKAS